MGFCSDLMGFYGDFMRFHGDLMGYEGDMKGIYPLVSSNVECWKIVHFSVTFL